jgi:hypothetical protein
MGRPDTRTETHADSPIATRLARFLDLERRDRVMGRHRAVADLHRRTNAGSAARLRQYLRIARGREA